MRLGLSLLMVLLLGSGICYGQSVDSLADRVLSFPGKLFNHIHKRTAQLDSAVSHQTQKYLEQMEKRERRLQRKLAKIDSAGARRLFANSPAQYAAMLAKFKSDTSLVKAGGLSGAYQPYVDSLGTGLTFLQRQPCLSGQSSLAGASTELQQLQGKLQGTNEVQDFIRQRQEAIGQYLDKMAHLPGGLQQAYQGMGQQMYYYRQQVDQYKQLLNNPDEMEKKLLAVLNGSSAFQGFMQTHSQLASLFGLPGNATGGTAANALQALTGLQTRDQLQQIVQGQISAGGSGAASALGSNLSSAQSQLNNLQNKLQQYGNGGGDIGSTDFKPNDQKTKTLWQRLEYGVNVQTSRTNYNFPTTTDIGLSLGYKLGKQNSVGIGASYKLGWGSGFNDVALTNQGLGLRSYVDVHVKGSWSLTGGFEYNYVTPFRSLQQVRDWSNWTRSGLVGVTKTVSVKNRLLKQTKLQLLWDFLSYSQVPRTQPVLFRVGYGF